MGLVREGMRQDGPAGPILIFPRWHRLIEHRLKFLALSDEKGDVPTRGVSNFPEAGE